MIYVVDIPRRSEVKMTFYPKGDSAAAGIAYNGDLYHKPKATIAENRPHYYRRRWKDGTWLRLRQPISRT